MQRLWSAHAIAPHRLKSFKLSKDLAFEQKFSDVVGLYLNPPDCALLLCCDNRCQAECIHGGGTGLGQIRQGPAARTTGSGNTPAAAKIIAANIASAAINGKRMRNEHPAVPLTPTNKPSKQRLQSLRERAQFTFILAKRMAEKVWRLTIWLPRSRRFEPPVRRREHRSLDRAGS